MVLLDLKAAPLPVSCIFLKEAARQGKTPPDLRVTVSQELTGMSQHSGALGTCWPLHPDKVLKSCHEETFPWSARERKEMSLAVLPFLILCPFQMVVLTDKGSLEALRSPDEQLHSSDH